MRLQNPSWAAQNYRLNQERIYNNQKKYRVNHKEKIRQYYTRLQRTSRQRIKNSLFKILGGYKCSRCNCIDEDVLHIDHIYDTGRLDKKRFKTHDIFMSYYIRHPLEAFNNLQILCANCNWKKYKVKTKTEVYK